jgi:hypothetical protein
VTTPVEIRGAPVSDVPVPPTVSTTADDVAVRSRLTTAQQGWPARWSPAFAGPLRRRLIVSVENRSEAPTPPLRIVAGVGREVDHGEALPTRRIGVLQPGARRTVVVPVEVGAPTWGDYVVFGRLYGLNSPVRFEEPIETEPWGLELLLPLALLAIAQVVRYRRRRARRAADAASPAPAAAPPLANCSPDVGVRAAERYRTSPYDPNEPERAPVGRPPTNGNGHGEGDRMTPTRTAR